MSALAKGFAMVLGHLPTPISRLTTLGNSRLSRWYDRNAVMKYPVGTVLKLKHTNIAGYGIRPVAVVAAHTQHEGRDFYLLDVTADSGGNFFEWLKNGYVPDNVQRLTLRGRHFKWNVENHFRPAASSSPEEVYA